MRTASMPRSLLFAPLLLLAACVPGDYPTVGDLKTSSDGIGDFLLAKKYAGWTSDPAPRAAIGSSPHGKVRVFFNPTLEASILAGNEHHPAGSMVVKEAYKEDGKTLDVLLLDVKVEDGEGGDTWVFFEGYPPEVRGAYHGRNHPVCTACHQSGKDFVLSPLP